MSRNKHNPIIVNLNIGDQLTSISCGHVVVELLKFLVYQRLQIPYTYQWLKHVVTKKKMCEDEKEKDSFQSEKHFRIASTALENLDFIIKSLLQEISGPTLPDEICIALGGTPVTCKEIYRLIMPTMCHKPQCHSTYIANDQKIQKNVFRALVTSETLSQVIFSSLPPTNLFVFLKKKNSDNKDILNGDNFIITSGCRILKTAKLVVLDFRSKTSENMLCCNNFHVFGDAINHNFKDLEDDLNDDSKEFDEIESTEDIKWYQSTYVMKGFKDCVVNGTSVTNSWQES